MFSLSSKQLVEKATQLMRQMTTRQMMTLIAGVLSALMLSYIMSRLDTLRSDMLHIRRTLRIKTREFAFTSPILTTALNMIWGSGNESEEESDEESVDEDPNDEIVDSSDGIGSTLEKNDTVVGSKWRDVVSRHEQTTHERAAEYHTAPIVAQVEENVEAEFLEPRIIEVTPNVAQVEENVKAELLGPRISEVTPIVAQVEENVEAELLGPRISEVTPIVAQVEENVEAELPEPRISEVTPIVTPKSAIEECVQKRKPVDSVSQPVERKGRGVQKSTRKTLKPSRESE